MKLPLSPIHDRGKKILVVHGIGKKIFFRVWMGFRGWITLFGRMNVIFKVGTWTIGKERS